MTGPALVECRLRMPPMMELYGQVEANRAYAKRMVVGGEGRGKTVAICGAGPSLAEEASHIPPGVSEVWACNSALPYLWHRGHRVTHGFAIDMGEAMLRDWPETFPISYFLASCVHPKLSAKLAQDQREVTYFHNYLGIGEPEGWKPPRPGLTYEDWLYTQYPSNSVRVGHGLNAVPRAVCVALFMEYSHIFVYGADCAMKPGADPMPFLGTPEYETWLASLQMYADGRSPASFGSSDVMAEALPGVVDDRAWHTRSDMIMSARHLLDLERNFPGRITQFGDTLPNALRQKPPEFWEKMPALTGVGRVTNFGNAARIKLEAMLKLEAMMETAKTDAPPSGVALKLNLGGTGVVTPPKAEEPPPAPKE